MRSTNWSYSPLRTLAPFALAASLWLCLGDTASAAAPANDDFATAATLSGLPANATGTNVDATTESGEPDHAGYSGGHSVWWSWTAPSDGAVTVDTCASDFDTVLAIYTGSEVNALTPVASNRYAFDSCGIDPSKLSFEATDGQVYKIAIASAGREETGNIALALYRTPPPPNDDFANAAALTENENEGIWTGNFTNAGASKEAGEPNHAGDAGGHSVWFTWTAPRSGLVRFGTCGAGNTLDSLLAVYTGASVESLTPVASNHDRCSPVSFRPEAGRTYHIAVDGAGGVTGYFVLTKGATPRNDDFENATPLSGLSAEVVDFFNAQSTSETGEPNHAGNASGHSLWWSWTAPADGSVQIDTCSTSGYGSYGVPDTVLAIYTGDAVDALSPVASNDNLGSCGLQSGVTFTASAGRSYQIAADTAAGTRTGGYIALSLREAPAPPDPGDSAGPSAQITDGPKNKTKKKTATFEFTGTDARAVASFQCSLDGGAFAACTSPYTVNVKRGKHTFEVRAIDQAGNVGAAANDTWKRIKKKK